MRIRILKNTPIELKVEAEGVGHTLCILLQKALLEDANVDFAGYDLPHPLVSNSTIYIRTLNGVTPREVLKDAVERAQKINKEFIRELKKSLKT